MQKPVSFAILVLMLGSCSTLAPNRPHYVEPSSSTGTSGFDWQQKGPLDLIELLKAGAVGFSETRPRRRFTTAGTHYGWIQAEDIPGLIALLSSKEPCLAVAKGTSSYWDTELSTVGHEAAFLIEGFRKGSYPHTLNSSLWNLRTEEEVRRFNEWCETFMRTYRASRAHA